MNKSTNAHSTGKLRQFIVAIAVNLSTISYGISVGWPSPIIPQLRSLHPPVGSAKITEEQISWISGLLPIGALLIVPFSGSLTERFGRKGFGYMAGVPLVVSYLLILLGTSHVNYLYAARLIGGMGASMSMYIVPLYVGEIANEDVRGALGSLLLFSAKIGILIAYVAGAYLPYRVFAALALVFPVGFVVAFFFLPETPAFLVRRNRLLQAERSLMFLKANNRELVEQELARLKSQANASDKSAKKINLAHLFRDRATRRGLVIAFGVIAGQQFSGILAMINYAETIFKRATSSISAETSSIIISVIQVISAYLSTLLMERAGRRALSLVSCAGMTICHCAIGAYFCASDAGYDDAVKSLSWLPLVAFSSFMVSYCLGMGPIPFVVTSEVFANDVASLASTACYVFLWASAFLVVKLFGTAMNLIGGACFFVFAALCAVCFVFCYRLLPETRGRKREDIVRELAGLEVNERGEDEDLVTTKPV